MRKTVTIILCSLLLVPAFAAKPKPVELTYTYLSNDPNESKAQAEQHAIERAKQKALENAFGVNVSSIEILLETESQTGKDFVTGSEYFSLGGTTARGEWIKTDEERVILSQHTGEYWQIKVHVSGTARELSGTPIDIQYSIISNPNDREPRQRFFDNEDLLMRFQSPVDGALCVYLVDESKTAYCLLPYISEGKGYMPIKANEQYLFFSEKTDPNADELVLTTDKEIEHNVLYIVFSPNRFTKARDKSGGTNWRDQSLPRSLSYAEFVSWLAKNQTSDEDMTVRTELI